MDSRRDFRNLIAQFGVEASLAILIALGFLYIYRPQFFVVEQKSSINSEEAQNVLLKIRQAVVMAEEAQKAFITSKKESELNKYNEQVIALNHGMGHLLRVVNKDPIHLQKAVELNNNLKKHFDVVNALLTRKKLTSSQRLPASTEIQSQIQASLQTLAVHKGIKFSKDQVVILVLFLFGLIVLSRYFSFQKFKAEKTRRLDLENRSILLDTILNSMSDALIVIDSEGHFTHYNAAAQKIIGNRIKTFAHESSVSGCGLYMSQFGEPLSKRDLPIIKSLRGEKVDDQEFYVENSFQPEGVYITMSSRPINDIDGGVLGALAVFRDISRRKMVEHEWIRAREAAVEASLKKSDFLAAMSHEIRTPMNGVIGMTTLLSDTPLNSEQKEYVGIVKRSAESLLMLINDILDFSKMEAGKLRLDPQPFDLEMLAKDIVEMFKPSVLEKNVHLHLVMSEESQWYFQGDSGRIRQVLVNLVGNAVKFTPKGKVSLVISKMGETESGCTLKFEVKDTGPGLKEEERKSLFQKYFQTKAGMKVGGTGLGLSISKQLVSLMNGEIGVESVVGLGSNFWFTINLPVVALKDVNFTNEFKFSRMFHGCALLVEDQPVNQRVAQTYLRKLGLEVQVAGNGLEAVELFKQQKYDVVFMDCQMPVLDGYEATKRIRLYEGVKAERCPIVALTADSDGDYSKYESAGMDEYLAKPLELSSLVGVLSRLIKSTVNVIDVGALAELENYKVQDKNLVDALIDDFASSTPDLIESMRQGLINKNREVIFQSAHALKSSSATLGAKKLSDICTEIEVSPDFNHLEHLIRQVEEQFEISLKELKLYSENRSAA